MKVFVPLRGISLYIGKLINADLNGALVFVPLRGISLYMLKGFDCKLFLPIRFSSPYEELVYIFIEINSCVVGISTKLFSSPYEELVYILAED